MKTLLLATVTLISFATVAQAQIASGTCSPPNDVSRRYTTPAQVMFATGSTTITADGQKEIAAQAKLAKSNYIQQICLTGYTDKQGNAAANEKLARARSQAVGAALVKNGIDPKMIVITAPLGASNQGTLPFGMGGDKSQVDRRVDIKFGR